MQYRHPSLTSQTLAPSRGPNFALPVVDDGYAWWYVDASSDCGQYGLTLIAMLGCVFSPWYARARRKGPTPALAHSACNIALYGPRSRLWAMTERDQGDVARSTQQLAIGTSALRWEQGVLHVDINEITAPWPRPLRGRLRIEPQILFDETFELDAAGQHRWRPIAPHARIEVEWQEPALNWQGNAYLDHNDGDAPPERDFLRWQWSRAHADRHSFIFYDTHWRQGEGRSLALMLDSDGTITSLEAPPLQRLPSTLWGIARDAHCDLSHRASVLRTLEDGPFYARSWLDTTVQGRRLQTWHESVSLTRFASRWVQALLPVRLPRATR